MKIDQKPITLVKSQATKALKAVMDIQITNDEQYNEAGAIRAKLKELGKMITERENKILKPALDVVSQIRELFSPAKGSYKTACQLLDRKMLNYDDLREAEAEKERQKIAAKVESGYLKPETGEQKLAAVVEAPKTVKSAAGTTFIKKIKKVEITDESLIPREYLVIDMVKLNQAMLKEGKQVPGARIIEDKTMGSRGN